MFLHFPEGKENKFFVGVILKVLEPKPLEFGDINWPKEVKLN